MRNPLGFSTSDEEIPNLIDPLWTEGEQFSRLLHTSGVRQCGLVSSDAWIHDTVFMGRLGPDILLSHWSSCVENY